LTAPMILETLLPYSRETGKSYDNKVIRLDGYRVRLLH